MSQETLEIVTSKKIEEAQLQLALQCAPLIAGLKIANLLNIRKSYFGTVRRMMTGSDISWYVLRESGDKMTVLLYHEKSLKKYLDQQEARLLLEDAGKEAEVVFVSSASLDDLKAAKAFALGCPAMGAEVLEESEMDPFVSEVEGFASGKTIALFGSYGWGDGQWMRDWVDRMNAAGATVMNSEGIICQEAPDEVALAECESLGKQLAGV